MRRPHWLKQIWTKIRTWLAISPKAGVAIVILLTSLLFTTRFVYPTQAQSPLLDSKVAQLEFTVRQLESRLNQLSAQVGAPDLTPPAHTTHVTTHLGQPRSAQRLSTVSREEFENLSTLVIELKQEVRSLQR